jgi:hypothetical protein
MLPELPQPWRRFLTELDGMISSDVSLHCLGGFVVTACYGLPRPTGDLDVVLIFPSDAQALLLELAGRESELHKKHDVYLDVVTIATYPDNYEQRLAEVFVGACRHIRLFALDAYDLVLAKLERNLQRDRDDFAYLAQIVPLDLSILRNRYNEEMRVYLGRPEREDLTLQLWIDIAEERRNS